MENDFAHYLHQAWEVLKFIGMALLGLIATAIVASALGNQRRNGRY